MKIQLLLDTGIPEPAPVETASKLPIEDQVRDALDCIESGYPSQMEWLLVSKLYKDLGKVKQTPRIANIRKMIEPVLGKYGYHGVPAEGK